MLVGPIMLLIVAPVLLIVFLDQTHETAHAGPDVPHPGT
jgi:hypothetical protein